MIEVCKKYNSLGYSCVPTNEDKSPFGGVVGWKEGVTPDRFKDAFGIGIICGKISGGIECLDFDNHYGAAEDTLTSFVKNPDVKEIYERHNIPIEKTPSGGFHVLYKCSVNEGNLKLAVQTVDGKRDTIIETRGEGGYFVCDPTQGYKVIRNSILNIPVISEIDRAVLIETARSFNAVADREYRPTSYESVERPGDLYNQSFDAGEATKGLLREHGWFERQEGEWRRPDKKKGISATFGKVAKNVFYVFSSNAYPFESNRAYSPFQVLALLKFNGDFSATAESLPKPEKEYRNPPARKQEITENKLDDILKEAQIDHKKEVTRPPTILSIVESNRDTRTVEKRLFTLGNFSCIIGKAKSKKTFFLSMVAASLIGHESEKFKKGDLGTKNKILYFDTEQGNYDSHNTIKRIYRMARASSGLLAFSLRQFSPMERCQIIEYAFKKYGNETFYCVIDGIADLANAINDEDEATRVSTMLLRLTKIYNCHISTVIHQNKNDNWATGHLGSSVTKKAEIIISVTKDESNFYSSEVNCDMSRGIDFNAFKFQVNDYGIPEVIETSIEEKTVKNYYEVEKDDTPF